MRKVIYCCFINICLIFLAGCGKVELYPKDMEIEVGSAEPVIKVKDKVFQEGDRVIADDLAEVIDYSDVTLSILQDSEGFELKYETLRPGASVVLKAEDQYGNETIEEVSLNVIPKENPPFPEERSYEGLEKFPYKDLKYVSDEVY